jgi:hypothetical protein
MPSTDIAFKNFQSQLSPAMRTTLEQIAVRLQRMRGRADAHSLVIAVRTAMPFLSIDEAQALLLCAAKQMQETQMSFNLQYLQLQSQMQNENRSYTAVSNIMKTKHDTVKNSIANIR